MKKMSLKEIAALAMMDEFEALKGSCDAVAEDAMLDMTQHDAKYHGGKFDEKTMTCKLRDKLAKKDETDAALTGSTQQNGNAQPTPQQIVSSKTPQAIAYLQSLIAKDPNGANVPALNAAIAKLAATTPQPQQADDDSDIPSDEDYDKAVQYLQSINDKAALDELNSLPSEILEAAENVEDATLARDAISDEDAKKMFDDIVAEESKKCDDAMTKLKDRVTKALDAASKQSLTSQTPVAQAPTTTQANSFLGGNTMVTDGADGKTINANRKAAGLPELKALDNIDDIVSSCESGMRARSGTWATRNQDPDLRITSQKDWDVANKNFAETVKNIVSNGRICTVMKPHRVLELLQSGVFKNKYDTNYERQEQMNTAYGIPIGDADGATETPFSATCLSKDLDRMFESQAFNVYGLVAVEWKKDGGLVPVFSATDAAEPLRDEGYSSGSKARMYTPSLVSNPSLVSLPAFDLGYRSKQMINGSLVRNPIGETTPSGNRITPQAAAIKLFKKGPIKGDALDFDNAVNGMNHGPVVYNDGSQRFFGWNELQMLGKGSTDEIKALHVNSKKWASAMAAQASMASNNSSSSPINGQWSDAKSFVDDLVQKYGSTLSQMGIQIVLDGQDVVNPGTPVQDEAINQTVSLEKHDAKYHGGHFDGKQRCKYRQQLAKSDGADDLDPENVPGEETSAYGNPEEWEPADQSPCELSYDLVDSIGKGNPHTDVLENIPENERLGKLMDLARENLSPLEDAVGKSAMELGYLAMYRPANRDTGERIKSEKRIKRKVADYYDGDYGYVNDVIGATVLIPDDGDYKEAVDTIKKNLPEGCELIRVKKLDHRDTDGYCDIKLTAKFPNGGLGEIILINSNMAEVKQGANNGAGHITYNLSRVAKEFNRETEQDLIELSRMCYARGEDVPTTQDFQRLKGKIYTAFMEMMDNDELTDPDLRSIVEENVFENWGRVRPNDSKAYRFRKKAQ